MLSVKSKLQTHAEIPFTKGLKDVKFSNVLFRSYIAYVLI